MKLKKTQPSKREDVTKQKEKRIPQRYIVVGWIVTIIAALLGGGLLGPWFAERIQARPDIYFVREKCAIVPTGTNVILIKIVIKNMGTVKETSLQLRVRLSSPYVLINTTQNYYGKDFSEISAGEAYVTVTPVVNPTVEVDQHNTLQVSAEIVGTKVWDSYEFSESW